MKILRLHIDNFGKLSNLDLSFSGGLNAWQEENGFGKTTLATFIAVMFYSFPDEKNRKLSGDSLRERYRPWQGGKYGGNLVFENAEGRFTIIREFADSPVRDRSDVLDGDGRKTERFGKNIGQEIFGIDGESFLRTIFIRDNELKSSVPDDVSARLGSLLDDAMDMNRYEDALGRLKRLTDSLTPQRSTGSIHKDKKTRSELVQKLRGKDQAEENLKRLNQKARELEHEAETLREEKRETDRRIAMHVAYNAALADRKVYEGLLSEEFQRNNEYIRAKSHFPRNIPSDQELLDAESANRNAEKLEQTLRDTALTVEEKDTLGKAERIFFSSVILSGETEEMYRCSERMQSRRSEAASLRDELAEFRVRQAERKQKEAEEARKRAEDAKAEAREAEGIREKRKHGRALGIVFLGLGALLAVFSMVSGMGISRSDGHISFSFDEPLPLFLLIGGGLFFVAGLILFLVFSRKKKAETDLDVPEENVRTEKDAEEEAGVESLNRRIEEANAQALEEEEKIREFLKRFGVPYNEQRVGETLSALERLKDEQDRILEKRNRGAAAREKHDAAESAVRRFVVSLGMSAQEDLHGQLEQIEDWLDAYRNAERELENARKNKKAFEEQHDLDRLVRLEEPEGQETLPELQERSKDLQTAIQEKLERAMAFSRDADQAERTLDELRDQEEALEELDMKLDKDIRRYDLLIKAQEGLRTAKRSLSRKYASPVTEHFRKYLGMILKAGEEDFRVDPDGEVLVEDHNEPRAISSYSHGYRDLTYFCMRLALIDSMYQGEKPPVILDDPFVNLDDENASRALRIVRQTAEERQVLYFTCSASRRAEA
ncbi:MAG: AAA family ATPase [Lachnospiraceae bacterium]|nr:AAA family ATPase [Lachnospiraceae bacterium]